MDFFIQEKNLSELSPFILVAAGWHSLPKTLSEPAGWLVVGGRFSSMVQRECYDRFAENVIAEAAC